MYIDNIKKAMQAFDEVLDGIAIEQRPYCLKGTYTTGFCTEPKFEITTTISNENRNDDILDEIDRVIFNDPATVIIFKDGSKVQVKTCGKDTFNKEDGIRNALLKKALANDLDENGYLTSRGLGQRIKKILEDKSVDQKEIAKNKAKEKAEKNAKKKASSKKIEGVDNKKSTSKKTK